MKRAMLFTVCYAITANANWGQPPAGWGDFQIGLVNNNRPLWDAPMKQALSDPSGKYQLDRRYVYIDNFANVTQSYWGKDQYAWTGRNWSKDSFYVAHHVNPCIVVYMLQRGGDSYEYLSQNIQDPLFMRQYFDTLAFIADSSKGMHALYVVEPDVWGYVLQHAREHDTGPSRTQDDWSAIADNHFNAPCHINDLGISWLSDTTEFKNKLSYLPGAIIKTLKQVDPGCFAGILMAFWAWKPASATTLGLFQDTQNNIDITAREESKFLKALLGTTAFRGDFLGVEKNGTDLGCWKVMSPPSVYATTLNWNDQANSKWIGFSKTLGVAVGLPLLGWQISIGHTGLSNAVNEYEDTFFPYFFAHPQDYINAGFVGMMAGCANQDKGTVATIDVNAVGDKGWFYGQLAAFNAKRPYNLNVAPSPTIHEKQIVTGQTTPYFRIVNRSIVMGKSLPGPATLELFDAAGQTVQASIMNPGMSISLKSLQAGAYFARISHLDRVQAFTIVIY
jgi:hypothetical protein